MLTNLAALPDSVHIVFATILGLLVGSFLNVVIYRYPKLLKFQWTAQSYEWLNEKPYQETPPDGIVTPRSRCGNCKAPVKAWQNIPIISFFILRGKCSNCGASIGWRYPFVELLTGILSGYVVFHFGWSFQATAALVLTWSLVALSFIDFDHQLLPDDIVLPVLWLGLGLSLVPVYSSPQDAIIGAIAGYLCFWLVFQLFKLFTGKEGMGYGDFKLLSLFGAWLGWQMLPQIVFFSAMLGSIVGITLILLKKNRDNNAISFGPYIAIAGWVALIWGDKINQFYLTQLT